jgi:hypothetical protein
MARHGQPGLRNRRLSFEDVLARDIRGVAIVIVMVVALFCLFLVGVFFFLARGEQDRTQFLSYEIQATIIGEGVAARIASLVDQNAWADRFYVALARPGTPYLFTHDRFPFKMEHGPFARGDCGFSGVVYDHPTLPFTYRIIVEVSYRGRRVQQSWDKVYPQNLLHVTDSETTVVSAHSQGAAAGRIDQFVDGIRADAWANRFGEDANAKWSQAYQSDIQNRRSGTNPGRTILSRGDQ